MTKQKRPYVFMGARYTKRGLELVGVSGIWRLISVLSVTGRRCVIRYEGCEIEFEYAAEGYVLRKGYKPPLNEEEYFLFRAYVEMLMRAVYNGYQDGKKRKEPHLGSLPVQTSFLFT